MSIDKKLDELIEAINGLTSAIDSGGVKSADSGNEDKPLAGRKAEKPVKAKKAKVEEEEEFEEEAEEEDVINVKTVQALAKSKIAEGANRSAIKKQIAKLGGEAISDLSEKALTKLHTYLTNLEVDED